MAIRTKEIATEADLNERWVDSNTPWIEFEFIEETLEDCTLLDNGNYEATYDTLVLNEQKTATYILTDADEIAANGGETKTVTVVAGEYGIKP
jgi:hypothetical protein